MKFSFKGTAKKEPLNFIHQITLCT